MLRLGDNATMVPVLVEFHGVHVLDDILEGVDRLLAQPDIARIVVLYVIYPRLQLLPVHDAPHGLPGPAAEQSR